MRNSSEEDLQSVILDENNNTNNDISKKTLDKPCNFVDYFINFLLCCFVSVN